MIGTALHKEEMVKVRRTRRIGTLTHIPHTHILSHVLAPDCRSDRAQPRGSRAAVELSARVRTSASSLACSLMLVLASTRSHAMRGLASRPTLRHLVDLRQLHEQS